MTRRASDRASSHEIADALDQPVCPVCFLSGRSVGRFFDALAYEHVNDPRLRDQLRASRGFCAAHARRWLREARGVLPTALIYRDVIRAAAADLDAASARPPGRRMFRGLGRSGPARTAAPCLACDAEHEAESRYLDALLQALRDLPLLARFQASTGLCLPHTRLAVERGKPTSRLVAVHARQVAERLVDELSEVVRKEDYRFRHEPRTPAERTAPGDAVHWIVGSMDAPGRD